MGTGGLVCSELVEELSFDVRGIGVQFVVHIELDELGSLDHRAEDLRGRTRRER